MLASIAFVVAALYLAKPLLIPLTLAVLLSFLLSPVCDTLEHRGLGRIPAVLVTALLGFAVPGVVVWAASLQVNQLGPKIPEYSRNIELRLNAMNAYAVTALSKVTRSAQEVGENLAQSDLANDGAGPGERTYSVRVISAPTSSLQSFSGMFGTLLEVLGTIGIVIVLVIFFLIRREDLRDRFIHLMGKSHVTLTTQMLEDANSRVRRYLSMLFLINATFGISVGTGLYFIGVPNAILWGLLAAVLRFVPYIGPWIAAAMPIALSLAISTGWGMPLLTVGLFVVLELLSNNVMEPWLYGKNTGVSPVAVFVATIFWMWLWGPVGLLLATPLTVCVLVVGKHVPQLSFLGILLGSDPVFEPKTRIYQRLLAGDQEEAAELLDDSLKLDSLVDVYDSVLIPALALAEKHWQLDELSEGKYKFIMRCLREMIQDCSDRLTALPATANAIDSTDVNAIAHCVAEAKASPLEILCVPARTESDELTALMLAQVLETTGNRVQAVSVRSLASEMVDWVETHRADVMCVCATPPAAVMHARYLCKQIRDRLPHVKLMVGLWDTPGDLEKATERIGRHAVVVATMAEAQEQIRQFIASPTPTTDHSTEFEHATG